MRIHRNGSGFRLIFDRVVRSEQVGTPEEAAAAVLHYYGAGSRACATLDARCPLCHRMRLEADAERQRRKGGAR